MTRFDPVADAHGIVHDLSMSEARELFGIGLYRIGEAARLVGITPARLRRWVRGRSDRARVDAVHPKVGFHVPDGDETYLDFRDLMELRVIAGLVEAGLAPAYVRGVYAAIANEIGEDRPFSTERFRARFQTDGKRLFRQTMKRGAEVRLEEVLSGQHEFERIIRPTLRNVEFEKGHAVRWRPESGRNDVVLDPERSFGAPIVARSGVPTRTLFSAFQRSGAYRAVAWEFEVPERDVRSAVQFEQRLAA